MQNVLYYSCLFYFYVGVMLLTGCVSASVVLLLQTCPQGRGHLGSVCPDISHFAVLTSLCIQNYWKGHIHTNISTFMFVLVLS